MLHTQSIADESFIAAQVEAVGRPAKALPLAIIADGQDQPFVSRRKGLVRHDLQMSVALTGAERDRWKETPARR